MLQLGVKMSLGTNVTADQKYSGRSVVVQMSLGRSVGGRSVKVPPPESLELEPMELPQEVQHVVESPQQKQPVVKLLSADE